VVIDPPMACECCGGNRLRKLGEDVTRTLESVPRQWKVVETVREKFSCRDCEKISQAPAPFHAVARGWAGPSLLAMIMFEKFGQHQPLNRQAERYALEGVPIALSTMADAVGSVCAALDPLLRLVEAHVMAAARLHADDTTVPVLASGKTDTGRCWIYVRDDRPFGGAGPPAAMFYYSRDRKGEHPQAHLARRNLLQRTAGPYIMDMSEIVRTMSERMPWPVAQRVLAEAELPRGHGWEKTISALSDESADFSEKIETTAAALIEHHLCGEKLVRIYKITPEAKAAMQNKLKRIAIPKSEFKDAYPIYLSEDKLDGASNTPTLIVAMFINSIPVDIVGGAYDIAANYLKQTGRIPLELDIHEPLFDSIMWDFRSGTRNKLRLANRAITRFEKTADVLELV
jgi:transposase